MLRYLCQNLSISSTSVKVQAYKFLVIPSLECACSVWDPYNKGEIDKMKMVQCRAVRFVTNRQQNTFSVGDMLQCFKWPSLQDGQKDAWLVMMYKIANNNVLITNTNELKPLLRKSRNIHSSSFIIPPCKIQQKQKLFFPRMISDWNQLPRPIVKSRLVEAFKLLSLLWNTIL